MRGRGDGKNGKGRTAGAGQGDAAVTGRPRRARGASAAEDSAAVVRSLRQLFRAIQEYSKAIQKKVGLSGPQVWALTILEAEPGLSLGELSERMYAHPSTVSGIVVRLVERGAVRREVDAEDRRGIVLTLTAAGRRLLRRSPSPIQVSLRRALDEMPASALGQLRKHLEYIVRRSETDRLETSFFE